MAEGWDLRKDCFAATPNAVSRSDLGHIQGQQSQWGQPCERQVSAILLAVLQHLKEEIIVVTGIMYLQESRTCSPHPHHLMCMLAIP